MALTPGTIIIRVVSSRKSVVGEGPKTLTKSLENLWLLIKIINLRLIHKRWFTIILTKTPLAMLDDRKNMACSRLSVSGAYQKSGRGTSGIWLKKIGEGALSYSILSIVPTD